MTYYFIKDDIHACISDGQIIFLDLRNDAYLTLPKYHTPTLIPLIKTRKIRISQCPTLTDDHNISLYNLLMPLLTANIITIKDPAQHDNNIDSYITPTADCSGSSFTVTPTFSYKHVLYFIAYMVRALFFTKVMGFHWTIKSTRSIPPRPSISIDNKINDLNNLMIIFRHLRTFFYTAKDHCYFDCSIQVLFLRRFGHEARWIFGVQADPFKAHCWISVGDTVTSDWLITVEEFTPILQV